MKNKTAIVFPGQGSQFVGMGKELFNNFSSAKLVFEKINDILNKNLSKIIFDGPEDELVKTENTQPALMAVSIALITILEKDYNKKFEDLCSITAGHSLGEYSALCASKSISLEDTSKLLAIRGTEMSKCASENPGLMAAILGSDYETVDAIVKEAKQYGICQIANDNSNGQIVISGTKEAVNMAIEISKSKGIKRAITLPVSGAFHSELMENAKQKMFDILSKTKIDQPKVPIISNVFVEPLTNSEQIKKALIQQITGSVRWRETILLFEKNGIEQIIEIGSGKVLSGLASRTCPNIKTLSIQTIEDLKHLV